MVIKYDDPHRTAVEISRLRTAIKALTHVLEKYEHCRHGCVECFCTEDARVALALARTFQGDDS